MIRQHLSWSAHTYTVVYPSQGGKTLPSWSATWKSRGLSIPLIRGWCIPIKALKSSKHKQSLPLQVTIEKTPSYFISREAPARIRAMNATIKLLLIVREPATRVVSDYAQIMETKLRKGKQVAPFHKRILTADGEINDGWGCPARWVTTALIVALFSFVQKLSDMMVIWCGGPV